MAVFAKRYLNYRDEPYGKRKPLLWPVYVHRIMYPAERDSGLNLFQRAVLGLLRADCQSWREMADLLGMHPEMVLFILAQCNGNGWVDGLGKLTDSGIALLEKGEDQNVTFKSGLMFQDALSGALWPRISSDQPELVPLQGSGDALVFKPNRSSGKDFRPYVLSAKAAMPPELSPQEILEAYGAYRLDHFNANQLHGSQDLPERVLAHGIEFMAELPEPMYVLTWIAEDPSGAKPWQLFDPFGIRQQVPWLEKTFLEVLQRESRLVRELARIAGHPEPEKQSIEEWMQSMDQTIDMELLAEHAWACRQDLIARYYTSVKRHLLMIEQGLGKHALDATLNDAQKLCEAVCQWIIREFKPDMGIFPKITNLDPALNRSILRALELPFLTPSVVSMLAYQNLKQVRNALEGRNQSLKAMLFGAVLSTLEIANHPLRKIPAEKLAFEQLLTLADLRNEASHASGKEFNKDDVVRLGEFALSWTLLFKDWM